MELIATLFWLAVFFAILSTVGNLLLGILLMLLSAIGQGIVWLARGGRS